MANLEDKLAKIREQGWDLQYEESTQSLAWILPDGKRRYLGGAYTLCKEVYRKINTPYIFLGDASEREFYERHRIKAGTNPKNFPPAEVLETDPIAVIFSREDLLTLIPKERVAEWQEHFTQLKAGYRSVGCIGTYGGSWEDSKISQPTGTMEIDGQKIECGLTARGNWVAEKAFVLNGDDVLLDGVVFDSCPEQDRIETAFDVLRLEDNIAPSHGISELKRECWECQKSFYWWDIPGNFREKWERFSEYFCNRCS